LRTDISAFYDSISHKYVTKEIANLLKVPFQSKLMKLFRCLLQVPVLSYNHVAKEEREEETMHQGLCIGNSTEGFFANIYLACIDQEMGLIESIDFGRYNDDMRIFAKDRLAAKRAMLALQERLLTKGLNLNSSKTKFAEGEVEIERLRSRAYESDDYADDDDDAPITRPQITDKPFDEFDKDFELGDELLSAEDAKNFCHFLSKRLALAERKPGHVEMLYEILKKWHGEFETCRLAACRKLRAPRMPQRNKGLS
jgi:hypothetical protein